MKHLLSVKKSYELKVVFDSKKIPCKLVFAGFEFLPGKRLFLVCLCHTNFFQCYFSVSASGLFDNNLKIRIRIH